MTYPPDDRDLLNNRPVAQRLVVAAAGVAANMVLSFALLTTQVTTVGRIVQDYQPGVVIPALKAESAAQRAGIQVGDIIRAVRTCGYGYVTDTNGYPRTLIAQEAPVRSAEAEE